MGRVKGATQVDSEKVDRRADAALSHIANGIRRQRRPCYVRVGIPIDSKTVGRTLVGGPIGLSGVCISMRTPLRRSSGLLCSSASLTILAIMCAKLTAVYFKSSAGKSSCLLARLLFSLSIAPLTSSAVIGSASRDGLPANAGSSSTAGSLNWRLNCSVTRVFSSASLQITNPATSWIVNLATGFLVISRTARKNVLPSWRRSTSDATLSSPAEVLSRAFRRRTCIIVLRWRFSSRRRFGFLYSADTAAISAQCGRPSRMAAGVTTRCRTELFSTSATRYDPNVEHSSQVEVSDEESVVAIE